MKKLSITLIATLFFAAAMAQTKQEDKLFEKWEYFKAAQLYEEESVKNPSQEIYYKLGECYRKMCKYKEARVAYYKADSMSRGQYPNPEFYYNYGQVLKNTGNYEKAKQKFQKYDELSPSDPRGDFYMRSCDLVMKDHKSDLPIKIINDSSLNTPQSDMNPVFYRDGVAFVSTRGTSTHHKIYGWTGGYYMDIFYAKKEKSNRDFKGASPLAGSKIDQSYHDGPATFSRNFDTIYFARVGRDLRGQEKITLGIEQNKIYCSVLKDSAWTKPKPFFMNNDTFSVSHPLLTRDGKKLYFVADRPDGYGETDIYVCELEGKEWGKPKNLGPHINTFGREKYPSLDSAGTLYFSSDGYQGYGGLDLCVAKKQGNGEFAQAAPLKAPFNSSTDDFGMLFLRDNKTGYFTSNRLGGMGEDDIYYFDLTKDTLPCDVLTSTYVIGFNCNPPKKDTLALPVDAVFIPDTTKKIVMTYTNGKADKSIYILIHFEFDKYNILPEEAKKLDKVVDYLRENSMFTVEIIGHADSRGTDEYNQVLSENRARSTVNYIASKGIDKMRMSIKGLSFHKLVNHCAKGVECTEEEHYLNRRVEFKFSQAK